MTIYAHITGWGMAVPEKVLSNKDLAQIVETSDEWITERTGIKERRIAGPEDTTASLAAEAAIKALQVANVAPRDVDLIIVPSSSPEHFFPSTASLVQDKIGAVNAGAFDLSAACTGFIFGLNIAAMAIRSGGIQTALVIGAETLSKITNWSDRNTCILFGDGAGAFVLQGGSEPGGVLKGIMRSDGSGGDLLSVPAGGSALPTSEQTLQNDLHLIQMNGREIFRFATKIMARSSLEVIKNTNWTLEDVAYIVPHQANKRIIEAAARGLKLPMEKFIINLDSYGNTSTASIPLATIEAVDEGKINANDKLVFVGFGAGLTWGSLSVVWTGPFPTEKPVRFRWQRFLARLRSFYRRVIRWLEGLIWGRKNPPV